MKPASGDTDWGGERRLWPIVEGRSLDILCVLDLGKRGDAIALGERESDGSLPDPAMASEIVNRRLVEALAI